MVDIKQQDNFIKINVAASTDSGNIMPGADSTAYYSSLAKAWANKLDSTVDGNEYSSKYYAQRAKEYSEISVNAKEAIFNDSGFQAVSADLIGDDHIGICALNISSIQSAASNAQIASEKAVIATEQANLATQKAQEVNDVLAGAANTALSNITDEGKAVIRQNGAVWSYITGNLEEQEDLQEALDEKTNLDLSNCTRPYVIETYVNGTSWYRVWSDGWCEQGARQTLSDYYTLNLMKPYKDTNYHVQGEDMAIDAVCNMGVTSRTNSTVTGNLSGTSSHPMEWKAWGYILLED